MATVACASNQLYDTKYNNLIKEDTVTNNNPILGTILLCGIMGLVGQGIRAAVGLKSTATLQAQGASQQTVFDTAYFTLSLMIGFIAGVLGGLAINAGNMAGIDLSDPKLLLGLMASGYAGTDFIENAFTNLMPQIGKAPAQPGGDAQSASAAAAAQKTAIAGSAQTQSSETVALSDKVTALSGKVADIHAAVMQGVASGTNIPGTDYPTWALKRDATVARAHYWQYILDGAQAHQLPISVVLAIGSKESHWGLALKPPGPAGTGDFTRLWCTDRAVAVS